jgi:AhpD family alkylhydroperoxidase
VQARDLSTSGFPRQGVDALVDTCLWVAVVATALLDLKARAPKGSKMVDDVQVVNRRLDASGNEALIGMARMGADAFGYRAELRIDRHLAELLRLRVSQLNNCTYCLNLHYEAAREAGIPRAKIDTLTAWWETELHSEAEQAALRYTEALTRAADTDRDAAFQRFHDALAENFSPEEILGIVGVVVNMNVWTRIKLAEGAMPGARPY